MMRWMDPNQAKVIELLREVHLIAFKEIERLNLRITELESRVHQPAQTPAKGTAVEPSAANPPSAPKQPETGLLNEHEVATFLNVSLACLRRWLLFRKGPKFLKIGRLVRYRRGDVETWLHSCPGLE
jgi:predicted DNA-binding transcriptional regulator AlpA